MGFKEGAAIFGLGGTEPKVNITRELDPGRTYHNFGGRDGLTVTVSRDGRTATACMEATGEEIQIESPSLDTNMIAVQSQLSTLHPFWGVELPEVSPAVISED